VSKLSLRGIDIVMSYREATAERRENLYTVLRHLDYTYRDYTVWLMEADRQSRFDWRRLADPKIRHVFIADSGPFPKAMLYNTGARLCGSPVICFHDADCVARPAHFVFCVERMLFEDGSDEPWKGIGAMCPFQSMINIAGDTKGDFVRTPDFGVFTGMDQVDNLPPDATLLYPYNVGGIFLFRRKLYERVGGCNPECTGWGSEDNELFARSKRLGVDWQVVTQPMFHLNHDSPNRNGYGETVTAVRNKRHEEAANQMPLPELEALASRLSAFFA
jgi:hypothetical protein